jgi:hypothetical protein
MDCGEPEVSPEIGYFRIGGDTPAIPYHFAQSLENLTLNALGMK